VGEERPKTPFKDPRHAGFKLFRRLHYFLFVDKPGAMKESAVFLILTHATVQRYAGNA
jgi:hypothetical protein